MNGESEMFGDAAWGTIVVDGAACRCDVRFISYDGAENREGPFVE